MTITIPKFVPQVENFCVWGEGFTKEECDRIIELGEMAEFEKGRIGDNKLDEEVRDTDIVWLQPSDETHWIFERMAVLGSRINYDKFQMDLTRFDGFQYSKYAVDGHYGWHSDTIIAPPHPELHRKISFSVMLTEPEEYEGGELLICHAGNIEKPASLKRSKGDVIAFYSHLSHKVAPVTKGERVSLVTWAMGPKAK